MKRNRLIFLLPVISLLALLPVLLWQLEGSETYEVAIVDKTVPKNDYREHAGLWWVLAHEKKVKRDRSPYVLEADYYGYRPDTLTGDEKLVIQGRPDMIYVTDTYGVYQQDLQVEGNQEGERSGLVYGGMKDEEWQAIEQAHQGDTLLIAEFNSLATPTRKDVRAKMEAHLGATWSGWTGRYFPLLESEEVPVWVRASYEAQSGKPYDLDGPGLVFVHESDTLLILQRDEDEFSNQVWFDMNDEGKKRYPEVNQTPYQYWFDIMEPAADSTVLAEYEISVTEAGEQKLKQHHIPTRFPAIIAQDAKRTFYLAGDFADAPNDAWVSYKGNTWLRALKAGWIGEGEFYWRSYVPLMKRIIEENS